VSALDNIGGMFLSQGRQHDIFKWFSYANQ